MLDILVFTFRFPLVAYIAATLAEYASGARMDSTGVAVHGDTMVSPGDDVALQSPWDLISHINLPTEQDDGLTIFERVALYNIFRMSDDDPGPSDSEQ